jgi:hypothetical protein
VSRRAFLAALAGAVAGIQRAGPASAAVASGDEDPLGAMRAAGGAFTSAIWSAARFELQVIYTRIDRHPGAAPTLRHFRHGVTPERWFAPASLVKLPVAALALERLAELAGQGVERDSTLVLRGPPRCAMQVAAGAESVARSIRRMFVASENEPFNRLYEMLGQDRIHARLAALGCPMSRIIGRIAQCSPADNRSTGAGEFRSADGSTLAHIEAATAATARGFPYGRAFKGRAWVEGRKITPGPRDFSDSNFLPLDEAHRMLIAVVLPEAVPPGQRLRLEPADHAYLRHCMGMLPAECADPVYETRDYPVSHAKYLLGGGGTASLPAGVRIFNKVGRSFGYLADCAYFSDTARGAEFFLSASLYVNEDDVLNDGRYEYRESGLPFLVALGRVALELDAARPRAHPFVPLGADGRFAG